MSEKMPTGRRPGRPSRLNEHTQKALVEALKNGCYRETAVRAAGIGMTTFTRWLEQGEADDEADKDTPHRALRRAVIQAEAEGEAAHVEIIHKAADATWQAGAWLLERKYPARWGRRMVHEVDATVQADANVEVVHNKPVLVIPAPDRREAVARIYHDAVNGGGSSN